MASPKERRNIQLIALRRPRRGGACTGEQTGLAHRLLRFVLRYGGPGLGVLALAVEAALLASIRLGQNRIGWIGFDRRPQACIRRAEEFVVED